MYVYIASPRPNPIDDGWPRSHIIVSLQNHGWTIFDPWSAWSGGAKSEAREAAAEINLQAVHKSAAILAYCPDDVAATGTAMEIGYCLALRKPTLLWNAGLGGAMFSHPRLVLVNTIPEILRGLETLRGAPAPTRE